MLDEVNLPQLSLEERDRRYKLVREKMAARGLDCLVMPHNTGDWDSNQTDIRYLTGISGHCTGAAAVFPIDGEPIAMVRDPQRLEWWKRAKTWVKETRARQGLWSDTLVQAIRDVGHASGKIGVIGLQDVRRNPEGTVSYTEWMNIMAQLVDAQFEDATVMMQDVRMSKSAEEIVFMERAAGLADAASLALFETAAVGVTEHEVYGAMVGAMIRAGGENPTMALFVAEQEPNQTYLMPTFRKLEPNDIILTEMDANYCGYLGQSDESVCVGTPPAEYERLFDVSLDCFHLMLEQMKPGVPWAEMIRISRERIEKENAGFKPAVYIGHGQGIAEDGPMIPFATPTDEIMVEGQCFILKCGILSADGKRFNRAGNSIVIEKNGARRLGKLEMKMRRVG